MEKIAIIEDDQHIGDILERTLAREGYETLRAYSGTEALYLLSGYTPDMVLLDLMLPGLSGEEILPQIKGIPVIVVSAKAGTDDKVSLLLDGAGKTTLIRLLEMRQRLGIAMALCGSPDFLVLDEPVNGLNPQGIIEIQELTLRLNKEHQITILISSHILEELSKLATHYGFVDRGTMVREVSAAELDAACRKCIRLSVTDTKTLCRVLDGMGMEYNIVSDTDADIYGEISVTRLAVALDKEGCEVKSIHERDESLENYYMNLMGGVRDA